MEIIAAGLAPAPYDAVIVDTAPTGHTLRLLAAPDTVGVGRRASSTPCRQEHRIIRERFARAGRPEAADRVIALIAGDARDTGELLARLAADRLRLGHAAGAAVARRERRRRRRARRAPAFACATSSSTASFRDGARLSDLRPASGERAARDRAHSAYARTGRRVRVVAARTRRARGVAALARLGWRSTAPARGRHGNRRSAASRRPLHSALAARRRRIAPEDLARSDGASLLFFGGKGGAGKTTAAAAAAVRLARAIRRRACCCCQPIRRIRSPTCSARRSAIVPTRIPRRAAEPARPRARRRRRARRTARAISRRRSRRSWPAPDRRNVGQWPDSACGRAADGSRAAGDRRAVRHADRRRGAARRTTLIVVDTAPTGHALRLLEMPDAARDWVQVLLRMLLKYRSLVRPGAPGGGARRALEVGPRSCSDRCTIAPRRASSS